MHGFKVPGPGGIVVQRASQAGNGLVQRRIGDHLVTPYGIDQFLPQDQPVPVIDQVHQELEHHGFEMNLPPIAVQLKAFPVDKESAKTVIVMLPHVQPPAA